MIRNLDHFSWKANQAIHFSLKITEVLELPVHFDKNVLFLDKKKLKGKLQGRMKMVGDKIAVIGMKGTQKVSKISKDAKLNQAEKANLIVVHDDQEIHWVYPLKIGRNALATVESKQILRVEIMISPDCPNSPNDF